jgi:hypothetical protein
MMLRLVLVGMVAALGVTIPGGTNRGGWLVSAGRWANSAVVDWDTPRPDSSASQARRFATTRHGCEQCRLARAALALREQAAAASRVADSTKSTVAKAAAGSEKPTSDRHDVLTGDSSPAATIAFEPIAVGDDFYSAVAFELNRNAEAINFVQSPTAPTAILTRSQPVALAEGPEPEMPEVLCGLMDDDVDDSAQIAVTAQPRGENESIASDVLDSIETGVEYATDETEATPISGAVASPIAAASMHAAAATYGPELFEVIACQTGQFGAEDASLYDEEPSPAVVDDRSKSSVVAEPANPLIAAGPAVVAESTRQSAGRVAGIPWPVIAPVEAIAQPPTRVVQETTIPWPVFAPIDPHAGPSSAAESLSSAAAPRRDSSSKAGWGQAVDLTRQAMCAWMAVLVRSAPVEVTAR